MLTENSDVLAGSIEHAADEIGNDFAADAFHRNRRQRAGDNGVADQRVGLVTDDDLAGFGDRLQPRGEVRLRSDDCVVPAIVAAEISDVAETRIDAHANLERVLNSAAAPFCVEAGNALLHLDRHAQTGSGILGVTLGLRVAEKYQHGVTDEFIDRAAMRERNRRHFGEVLVEQLRDLLGLETLGGRGDILDVGEEDRQLLPLRADGDVLLPAENAFINLRR